MIRMGMLGSLLRAAIYSSISPIAMPGWGDLFPRLVPVGNQEMAALCCCKACLLYRHCRNLCFRFHTLSRGKMVILRRKNCRNVFSRFPVIVAVGIVVVVTALLVLLVKVP